MTLCCSIRRLIMKKAIRITCIFILIIFVCCSCSSQVQNYKKISSIYVYSSGYGIKLVEIKLDFVNMKAHWFVCKDFRTGRNEKAFDEGYQDNISLSPEKIEIFMNEINACNIGNWKDRYINNSIFD